jgi:hypothetical protein
MDWLFLVTFQCPHLRINVLLLHHHFCIPDRPNPACLESISSQSSSLSWKVKHISTKHRFSYQAALAHLGERQTEVNFCPSCTVRVFWRHCVRSTEAAICFCSHHPHLSFSVLGHACSFVWVRQEDVRVICGRQSFVRCCFLWFGLVRNSFLCTLFSLLKPKLWISERRMLGCLLGFHLQGLRTQREEV